MHRLYQGSVYHHRRAPVKHAFQYPVFFCRFDLDALRTAPPSLRLFRYNRRGIATLHDRDYLDGSERPLRDRARDHFPAGIDRVELITAPRLFGYAFNPVSFYLGLRHDGHLVAALAEVNNTFHERHLYVLRDPERDAEGWIRFHQSKAFHVSPFNDRRGDYLFRVRLDADNLEVHVDIERDGAVVFQSGLIGRSVETLADRSLAKALIRFPAQNLLTLPRIHVQAARLYFGKKMRYFPKPGPDSMMTIKTAPPTAIEKLGEKVFLGLLNRIATGSLMLRLPDGSTTSYGPGGNPHAEITVTDYTFFRRILLDGDIGLGEAFMYGQWTSPDPTGLLAFLIANRDALENGELASARLKWVIHRLRHLFRPNTKQGSRKNISAHYDLSNDFFRLFLDPTMMYSAAYHETPGDTLEQAQRNKMRKLIEKAGITADHHVLEIGSGWGGFAIEMARATGCRVTSITISREQLALARERVAAAGLADRVTIEFCDYRDIAGVYDRVVSVEMLEAVGHEHFDTFFRTIDRVMAAGGKAVLQTITIAHERYDAYRKSVDWIQKHIFPGGHLPSVEALRASMSRCSKLMIREMEDIGTHYATTLRAWRENLTARREDLFAMGYDDTFYRTWQYYFHYCEAAFATQTLGNMHLVLERNHQGDRG
ncbi:MAG TPA: DUF1365 family protein [Kiritimatiellia bacterium]|nr:DUF1365 family protein [Kiritimatiellia bacterium]HMO99277.1 DUF1365 family protein [Kiritimatiellia bacterium]